MRIAVAGGTGVVGRHVVNALTEAGHMPVVLARSVGVDVISGAGLADALAGVDAVVDTTNIMTAGKRASIAFFAQATGQLLAAEQLAGVGHHVALSIVGIDRVEYGYYLGKRRQEELVLAGPIPATVVRATQFHEFAGQLLGRVRGPVVPVPRMRMQPIAAREVGAALAEIAAGAPQGRAAELAGPEQVMLVDAVRAVLRSTRSRRLVIPVRIPGAVGAGMASGALVPADGLVRGGQRFSDWLAESR